MKAHYMSLIFQPCSHTRARARASRAIVCTDHSQAHQRSAKPILLTSSFQSFIWAALESPHLAEVAVCTLHVIEISNTEFRQSCVVKFKVLWCPHASKESEEGMEPTVDAAAEVALYAGEDIFLC